MHIAQDCPTVVITVTMDFAGMRILDPKFTPGFLTREGTLRSKSLNTAQRKVHDTFPASLLAHSHILCDPSYRFFPFDRKRTDCSVRSRHTSYSPADPQRQVQQSRSNTPLPRKCREARKGEGLEELRNLIERSVKSGKPSKLPAQSARIVHEPLKTASVLITQDPGKENESLRDTIDSQVLNSELHYIENLVKAGNLSNAEFSPSFGSCPLHALRSYDVKRRVRNPLPLHGVLFPSKPLASDPSDHSLSSPKPYTSHSSKRPPTTLYRLRVRTHSRKVTKNEESMKVSQVKFTPLHAKAVSMYSEARDKAACTEKMEFQSDEKAESDCSDSEPVVSKPNLKS